MCGGAVPRARVCAVDYDGILFPRDTLLRIRRVLSATKRVGEGDWSDHMQVVARNGWVFRALGAELLSSEIRVVEKRGSSGAGQTPPSSLLVAPSRKGKG